MATQTRYPQSNYKDGGNYDWVNPDNAHADDASVASVTIPEYQQYKSARQRYYNFGFDIPAGSTINSVTMECECKRTGGDSSDRINLTAFKDATPSGYAYEIAATTSMQAYSTSENVGTWTAAQLNDNTLSGGPSLQLLAYKALQYNDSVFEVDYVCITVDYTSPSAPSTSGLTMLGKPIVGNRTCYGRHLLGNRDIAGSVIIGHSTLVVVEGTGSSEGVATTSGASFLKEFGSGAVTGAAANTAAAIIKKFAAAASTVTVTSSAGSFAIMFSGVGISAEAIAQAAGNAVKYAEGNAEGDGTATGGVLVRAYSTGGTEGTAAAEGTSVALFFSGGAATGIATGTASGALWITAQGLASSAAILASSGMKLAFGNAPTIGGASLYGGSFASKYSSAETEGNAILSAIGNMLEFGYGATVGSAELVGAGNVFRLSSGSAEGVATLIGTPVTLIYATGGADGVAEALAAGTLWTTAFGYTIGTAEASGAGKTYSLGHGAAIATATLYNTGSFILLSANGTAIGACTALADGTNIMAFEGHALGNAINAGNGEVTVVVRDIVLNVADNRQARCSGHAMIMENTNNAVYIDVVMPQSIRSYPVRKLIIETLDRMEETNGRVATLYLLADANKMYGSDPIELPSYIANARPWRIQLFAENGEQRWASTAATLPPFRSSIKANSSLTWVV